MVENLRVLRCRTCGHRMRFGAGRCGFCGMPSQFANRYAFWVIPFGIIVVFIVLMLG